MEAEKRKNIRVPRRLLVRFGPNGLSHLSFTADISRTGLFILTPNPYPPGQGLSIDIRDENKTINLTGFIVWSKKTPASSYLTLKGGMGIKILDYQNEAYQNLLTSEKPS